MKTLKLNKLGIVLALVLTTFVTQDIFSQGPPPWAPAHGYRAKTKHIYFPDQNFYYDVAQHNYLYLNNGSWSISVSLPSIFANINLENVQQVQLEIGGHRPYIYNEVHIVKYKKFKHKGKKHKGYKHKKYKH